MCFPNVTARNGFNGRLNFKKPFMTTVWPQHQRIINYKRIINKQILNRHRSEVKKKNHHGIHYNTYTYEISTKLSHYFHTCHLLPKFSESRRNSPISQAIRNSISTGEKLNLDYNPQRFRTFSMFAEYNTANSPLSKQLLRVYEYRGRPGITKSSTTNEKKFYETVRVSRETVYTSGVVWGICHAEYRSVCFQGNKNLMNSFTRQREFLWKPVHKGVEWGFLQADYTFISFKR